MEPSWRRTCEGKGGEAAEGSESGERKDAAGGGWLVGGWGGSAGRRSPARGERGGVWRRRFGRGANARGEPPRGSRGTEAASPTEATNAPRPNRRGQTPRRDRARAHLDDVQGLDDAGGAHAGEAAVEERLDRVPGGVISERHRGSRGVGRMRRARRSVGARGDRRPGLVGRPIGAEAQRRACRDKDLGDSWFTAHGAPEVVTQS